FRHKQSKESSTSNNTSTNAASSVSVPKPNPPTPVQAKTAKAVRGIAYEKQEDDEEQAKTIRRIVTAIRKLENPPTQASEIAIQGYMGSAPLKVVVDSACQDNCMSVAAAERIGFEINKNNPAEYFLLADRITKVPIYGRQKARLDMGGY